MEEKKFLSLLGLCRKSGSIILGTDLVTKALPSNKVKAVFYTSDSSENTQKKITVKCSGVGIACARIELDGVAVALALGLNGRACVVGITNDSFAKQLLLLAGNELS